MEKTKVKLAFGNEFSGTLCCDHTTIKIGKDNGQAMPYELLLGALGSCLYATFVGIAHKKKLAFESVEIRIEGEKREEVPTTLKRVAIFFVFNGVENLDGFSSAVELAAKYCSVYSTLAKVAEIVMSVEMGSVTQ